MERASEATGQGVKQRRIGVGPIAESSFLLEVPGSADRNESSQTVDLRGANTGSFGFDTLYPTNQVLDPARPVVRKRQRLHRGKHTDYERCAKPALYPGAPKSLVTAAELGLRQCACRRVRTH